MPRWFAFALAFVVPLPAAAADPPSVPYTLKNDITFATVGDEKLQLDVAIPKGDGPHPCIVCLHGGGWKVGSRKHLSQPTRMIDLGLPNKSLLDVFASHGYVTVSVSYRLAPANKFPAQIRDVKTAVRFLRANAKQFDLDPDRIAALGFSAGGHLAALLGTTDNVTEFEGELYPGQSSRVQCVIDFFGPSDLTLYGETPGIEKSFIAPFLGGTSKEKVELYKRASPLEHVSKDDPPFLIVHGTADILVPIIHSERLHERLTAAGVKSELVPVRGEGHGWGGDESLRSIDVSLKFLAEHLAKKGK
jgi:acetyl esterase/lipase